VLSLLLACTAFAPISSAQRVDSPSEAQFNDEDMLILEARLEGYVLGENLLAYLRRNSLFLPLGELAELLDFAILVDAYAGRADGWFMRESRGFHLDLERSEVVIAGVRTSFDPDLVQRDITEIYVEGSLLSSWLGIRFEMVLSRMELRLHPSEKLPIQLRLLREERRRWTLSGRRRRKELPRRISAYQMASWPTADLTLRLGAGESNSTSSYTLFGSADLGAVSWKTSASGSTSETLSVLRLLGSRTDIDGTLLGPLGLRTLEFGDVSAPPVPLVSRVEQGPGVYASNGPLVRPDEFASTSVRGEAPAGWEVELYRNGTLLDFQIADSSGRYEFPRVAIGFGENVLRSVAYGPQGQVRESVERHRIGTEMLSPGEMRYRFFALSPDRSLLDPWIQSLERPRRDRSGWDLHGQVEYGIGSQLSVTAGLTQTEAKDGDETFGTLAFRASSRGILAEAEIASTVGGGSAIRFSTQTRLLGVSLLLQQSLFHSYSSNEDLGTPQLSSETKARAEGSIALPSFPSIAYALRIEHQSFENSAASDRDLIALRTAGNTRGVSFSHELYMENSGGVASSPRRIWSQGLISGRARGFQLRGRAQYEWKPDRALKVASLTVSRRIRRNLSTSIGISRSSGISDDTSVTASASWIQRRYELSFELGRSSQRGNTATLTIGSSVGRDPQSGELLLARRGLASSAAALARVYLDRNANDVFDAGDEPVPDVSFLGNAAWRATRTDAKGLAFLQGVPVNRLHDVRLDPGSVIDPFWIPAVSGYSVVGHEGGYVELDFPIRLAGEIDGTVYLERHGHRNTRRNLKLELVDAQGSVVQTIRSDFDGYFLFQGVLPAEYRVRVKEGSITDARIRLPEIVLQVPADGGAVSGLELILQFEDEAEREAEGGL
jgi:hypothetical protein